MAGVSVDSQFVLRGERVSARMISLYAPASCERVGSVCIDNCRPLIVLIFEQLGSPHAIQTLLMSRIFKLTKLSHKYLPRLIPAPSIISVRARARARSPPIGVVFQRGVLNASPPPLNISYVNVPPSVPPRLC